jgi:nitronate monooxygenase
MCRSGYIRNQMEERVRRAGEDGLTLSEFTRAFHHTDDVTGDSTIRTNVLDALRGVPWPREYSFRFLKNKLSDEWSDRESEAIRAFGSLSERYAQARARNDLDTVAVTCGEAVGLLRDRPTAESIVKLMAAQAADLLRRGANLTFVPPSQES